MSTFFASVGAWFRKAWLAILAILVSIVGLLFWLWSRERRKRKGAEAERDAERVRASSSKERLEEEERIVVAEKRVKAETDAKTQLIQDELDVIEEKALDEERKIRESGNVSGGVGDAFNDAFGLPGEE